MGAVCFYPSVAIALLHFIRTVVPKQAIAKPHLLTGQRYTEHQRAQPLLCIAIPPP